MELQPTFGQRLLVFPGYLMGDGVARERLAPVAPKTVDPLTRSTRHLHLDAPPFGTACVEQQPAAGGIKWPGNKDALAHGAGPEADEAIALARERGFPFPLALARVYRGWALAGSEGLEEIERGLEQFVALGAEASRPHGLFAAAYSEAGRSRDALLELEAAMGSRSEASIFDAELYRVKGEVQAAAPAFLVMSDLYSAGWEAEVDGRAARVHRANYLMRAVHVPPGKHTVEFTYRPVSLTAGIWASVLGCVALAALCILQALARRKTRNHR